MYKDKEYKILCKAALAYKNGYIPETQFKKIASGYIRRYIYRNLMKYNKDSMVFS